MASEALPHLGQRSRSGDIQLEGLPQEAQKLVRGRFLFDLGVHLVVGEEGQGHLLRVAGAEDQGQHAGGEVLALLGERVDIGKAQFARLHLLLDFGGGLLTQDGLQGVSGDDCQTGVAVGRLLSWLHHHARCLQFNQGVVGLGLIHRHVNQQPGWLKVVQQRVDLVPQLEEAAFVSGDLSVLGSSRRSATEV